MRAIVGSEQKTTEAWTSRYIEGIRNTEFFDSSFSSHNVIVHWHEDDSSLDLPSFTLYFSHHVLNLCEDLQCSESCEIFHSNSIGRSIQSNSWHWNEFRNQSIFSFQALTGFSLILPYTIVTLWLREFFAFDNWTASSMSKVVLWSLINFPVILRAESVRRPDSLQWLAGALEVNHWLLVRVGTVVLDLDGEALDEDRSVGKGTKGTLGNDIKDTRRECACGMPVNDADTPLSWATECAVCAHETLQKVYSVFTPRRIQGVASDWTRKTQLIRKNLDDSQILRVLSRTIFWSQLSQFPMARLCFINCFIDHLWSDHLSSCQLCCCHTFQVKDHSCELHQDVEEDHWEDDDDVGCSRSFVKYCSECSLNIPGTREF